MAEQIYAAEETTCYNKEINENDINFNQTIQLDQGCLNPPQHQDYCIKIIKLGLIQQKKVKKQKKNINKSLYHNFSVDSNLLYSQRKRINEIKEDQEFIFIDVGIIDEDE
ncbi:hypothetical protein ABPG74_000196 [Tetrahymena malaccensis]